jgi:hypothetical protein
MLLPLTYPIDTLYPALTACKYATLYNLVFNYLAVPRERAA